MIRTHRNSWQHIFFLLFCLVGLTVAGCATQQANPLLQPDGSMIVKGKVTKISVEEGIVTIQPPKGAAVTVKLTPATDYTKLKSAKGIKTKQPVEVRYRVEGQENLVISVSPIAEGSC